MLTIFVGSPISGRPQPNPCVSIIRRLQSRLSAVARQVDDGITPSSSPSPPPPAPTPRPTGDDLEKGKKALLADKYNKLLPELQKAETELTTAQQERDRTQLAFTNAGANPSAAVRSARDKAEDMYQKKLAVRDVLKKDVDEAKTRAGL